jgi:c(7)-type cytochrome triheme protein
MKRAMALLLAVLAASASAQEAPGRKRRAPPQEYGRVLLGTHAAKAKLAPAVFDHWRHRARYTCRACHVDVGFAMTPGATDVRAADNAKGQYCGACHDGRTAFAACALPADPARPACARCHQPPGAARDDAEFAAFAKGLPRERFGNGIDWEKAEATRLITPSDVVEGLSIRRPAIGAQKDFALGAKVAGMPDIIFSHAKHTVWSGCEGCHPEIFKVRRGATKFTMVDIFEGRSCGACHLTVAFPVLDCQRCHSKPVQ